MKHKNHKIISIDVEKTFNKCPSANEWIKKTMVHLHNGILCSREKEGAWMHSQDTFPATLTE